MMPAALDLGEGVRVLGSTATEVRFFHSDRSVATSTPLPPSDDLPQTHHDSQVDGGAIPTQIRALAFSPDGYRLIVAAGTRVLLYDTSSSSSSPILLATLKAHKDAAVTAVDWSPDGQHFASGGNDGKVVVWSSEGQGLLKYAHQAAAGPVLQVAHEPAPPYRLCSVTVGDAALWMPGTKAVRKEPLGTAICGVSWCPDGRQLALALADGSISLRELTGSGLEDRGKLLTSGDGSSEGRAISMAWATTDTIVVGRSGGLLTRIFRRDAQPTTTIRIDTDPVHLLRLPGEGALLVAGNDGSLTTLSVEKGSKRRTLRATDGGSSDQCITAMAAAAGADSSLLALGMPGGVFSLLAVEPAAAVIGQEEDSTAAAPQSPQEALEALVTAGRWEEALALVASAAIPGVTSADVLRRQARWHLGKKEWRAAVGRRRSLAGGG